MVFLYQPPSRGCNMHFDPVPGTRERVISPTSPLEGANQGIRPTRHPDPDPGHHLCDSRTAMGWLKIPLERHPRHRAIRGLRYPLHRLHYYPGVPERTRNHPRPHDEEPEYLGRLLVCTMHLSTNVPGGILRTSLSPSLITTHNPANNNSSQSGSKPSKASPPPNPASTTSPVS